jgi:DNA-directed RNA polymerase specialized sigma24 family protein
VGWSIFKIKPFIEYETLIDQLRDGRFRQEMIGKMATWAMGITQESAVSFDIAEQVFDEFLEKVGTFKSRQSAENYLLVSTRNQAITWCQRNP